MLFRNLIWLVVFSVTVHISHTIDAETIVTKYGPVEGTASNHETIEVFKGIPYAAPPVGALRWRPPQPPSNWSEVRMCDQFAPSSIQRKKRNEGKQSEDCLYLNVWTPRDRSIKNRPVMVWIHGGGFTQGAGHKEGYNGTRLAQQGVVVVTINYRLGALGFMTHPELSKESPHRSSGNYAILDQIEALKWVRDNISKFGGDPKNVTIFGESAGGTSVYLLTATPLSKGLFHRAILQSPWLDPSIFRDLKKENENGPSAETLGQQQVQKVLGTTNADVMTKLRAMSVDEVLEKIKERWPVVTDGWIFPKAPHRIYEEGEQHDIPVIVGTNRDEGTMFTPREPFGGTLANYRITMDERFGEHGSKLSELYAPESKEQLWKVGVQVITDTWFVQPSRAFARAMSQQGSPVWMYHFTKPVWGWMGAAHAAEIRYVFGNLEEPNPNDKVLSEAFMDYWVQFAKTGNPNIKRQPDWPPYSGSTDLHLNMDKTITVGNALRKEACDLIDEILKEKRQDVPSTNQIKISNEGSSLLESGEYFVTQTWSQENGFQRPYFVTVPDPGKENVSDQDQQKFPVLIFLHGNGGNGKSAMQGFLRKYKKIPLQYIMVFAQGYQKSWNIVSERSKADDRGFIESIVNKLAQYTNVDSTHFSIMGNSNGAALVNQLAIESKLPNIRNYITGVSPLNVWQHDGNHFKAKGNDNDYRKITTPMTGKRFMNISGTEDKLVPYHGGPSKVIPAKGGKLAFVDAEESIYRWARQMGYKGDKLTQPSSTDGNLEIFSYLNGDVIHYKVNREGHGASRSINEERLLNFLEGGNRN